jgi:hypothetical protein
MNISSQGIPPGIIMMWSTISGQIPIGWSECDGGVINGFAKPNLRGRFIIGAGGAYGDNTFAGNTTYTLTALNIPAHTHPLTSISTNAHAHTIPARYDATNAKGTGGGTDYSGGDYKTTNTGGASAGFVNHTHSYTTPLGGGVASPTPISLMPRYYPLIYIIKLPL